METIQKHTDKLAWWTSKSSNYNKGLAIAGVITIVTTALLFYLFDRSVHESFAAVYIGTPVYLLYMGTLNVILFVLEFADHRYNKRTINFKTMDTLFNLFFWTSMTIPFAYPIFILTMFCIY